MSGGTPIVKLTYREAVREAIPEALYKDAADQILNNAAAILHMSGGQFNIPLVIHRRPAAADRRRLSTPTASRAGTRTFQRSVW